MSNYDTIAAISTPIGEGGIGIVRISGPEALDTALKLFAVKGAVAAVEQRRLYYGTIFDPHEKWAIDDGFMVFMKGPRSYTGADVVEIHCHGGTLVLKKTLEAVVKGGARMAGPGEFTRQAFLNGKLDLAQAESVIDLIRAQTEVSLQAARGRLDGAFSRKVGEIKEALLDLLVNLEAELDFPDDEVEGLQREAIEQGLADGGGRIERLLATYEEGRAIKDGVRVLILGRPNVGKSSLLNVLLRQERAIVTPHPGTTRDVIEEVINLRGIPVRLMDTAGLRDTDDHVESIGVRLARERIETAELILLVIDVSCASFDEDLGILRSIGDKKVIVAANKTDLVPGRHDVEGAFGVCRVMFISALSSTGIEELKDAIYAEATGRPYGAGLDAPPGELVATVRQRDALAKALEGVWRAGTALKEGLPGEFIATDLRYSIDRLGEITGETTTEDILDRVFSGFCIGK